MSIVIDRSKTNTNKSAGNKQRFIQRNKTRIRDAIKKRFQDGDLQGIQNGHGIDVEIDGSTTEEYQFATDPSTGNSKRVLPGNAGVYNGDTFPKPRSGDGGKPGPGDPGDGENGNDDFVFHLNEEEFRNLLFEYLELPDFIKKSLKNSTEFKMERAGFKRSGTPAQLSLIKSYLNSYARRLIMENDIDDEISITSDPKVVAQLQKDKDEITLFEEDDLRFKNWDKKIVKINSAVVFCIMDVSGSMTEDLKSRAKRFFYLLYLFLKYKYTTIEIRFLAHTTDASEVDEQEFFYGTQNGGTTILPAYKLMNEIIQKDYAGDGWNIYFAQATDGDCWGNDVPESVDYLAQTLLPMIQYGAYLEVANPRWTTKGSVYLDKLNKTIKDEKFQTRLATRDSEVFDIFIELFKRK